MAGREAPSAGIVRSYARSAHALARALASRRVVHGRPRPSRVGVRVAPLGRAPAPDGLSRISATAIVASRDSRVLQTGIQQQAALRGWLPRCHRSAPAALEVSLEGRVVVPREVLGLSPSA